MPDAQQPEPGSARAGQGTFTREDVERVLARTRSGRVAADVGAISIESPVRRLRGELFDYGEMARISAFARERGIGMHLDGARLFLASAFTGITPAEYASHFDTVYISLWKCFNAMNGAVLAGPASLIDGLFHVRRMFGGALWSAWPFAAVARHYAEGFLDRYREGGRREPRLRRRASRAVPRRADSRRIAHLRA